MANQFTKIAFTNAVKEVQALMGSRKIYSRSEAGPPSNQTLTDAESLFIAERDSFYLASTSETGWPYVQHRGGPVGFLRVISDHEIGFADFSGNRQYISVGNIQKDKRVALILVDYPNQTRLKIFGEIRIIDSNSEAALLSKLAPETNYNARVERGLVIEVFGYDWNCPQHITPRWTAEEIAKAIEPLKARIRELEAKLGA